MIPIFLTSLKEFLTAVHIHRMTEYSVCRFNVLEQTHTDKL